ncbi:helix-turn-helix domain-containing protein [Nocardia sp. CDC159]|uniref:Helix-turn-helix domain-containing protein n=1 Tax=Nocardia pulmonis TaxID=2951408 RepID=A0A9X2IZ25_9NOCA|nr:MULTISPECIES: helix-turn-helix domain-containing protein [Nocardia]MCM6777053.1 helix-turn-helix domain-containing protein [Nocardia pulmonis]MCM6789938.1 helix-turn-helix domain-containing protein [Nocardia sp. CDC159]
MPGDRLTQDDRRFIAAGLAEGLGYAEIARRLGRPTSTVSREVSRNGGPGRYRPERAHRLATLRARRVRPATAEKGSPADESESAEVTAFIAELTELLVQTGIPRMPARVLARIYLSDTGSSTAAELARVLRVSPASVSAAVALLESYELIRREREPGTRRDRYVLDNDAWYRSTVAGIRSTNRLAEAAQRGAALLGSEPAARLRGMGRFMENIGRDMQGSVDRWRPLLRDTP